MAVAFCSVKQLLVFNRFEFDIASDASSIKSSMHRIRHWNFFMPKTAMWLEPTGDRFELILIFGTIINC